MHCNSFFFGSQRVFRGAPPCDPTLRHCPLEFNSITRSTMLGFTISGVASRRRGGRLLYEHTDWRGGLRAFIDRIINITIGSTCRRPILWAKNGLESQASFFHVKRWCFFVFFVFLFLSNSNHSLRLCKRRWSAPHAKCKHTTAAVNQKEGREKHWEKIQKIWEYERLDLSHLLR